VPTSANRDLADHADTQQALADPALVDPAVADDGLADEGFAEDGFAERPGTGSTASVGAALAPPALLERLAAVDGMGPGRRRLVVVLGQLGDFDSFEYAQALVPLLPQLESAGIALLAIGLGNEAGRQRFCAYTGFPLERLLVDAEPQLHQALGLYAGLRQVGGPWPNLLLMCAGIGSPGTLAEVLRGYTGDRSAPSASPMTP
jgi:hypothetical protein